MFNVICFVLAFSSYLNSNHSKEMLFFKTGRNCEELKTMSSVTSINGEMKATDTFTSSFVAFYR